MHGSYYSADLLPACPLFLRTSSASSKLHPDEHVILLRELLPCFSWRGRSMSVLWTTHATSALRRPHRSAAGRCLSWRTSRQSRRRWSLLDSPPCTHPSVGPSRGLLWHRCRFKRHSHAIFILEIELHISGTWLQAYASLSGSIGRARLSLK